MWSPHQKDLSIDPNNTVNRGHVVEQVRELGPFSSIMSKSIAKTYRNDVADKYANWGTGRVGSLSLVTIVRNTGKLAADTGLGPETFSRMQALRFLFCGAQPRGSGKDAADRRRDG